MVVDEKLKLEIAKFRFGVIADFVTGVRLGHGEREKLMREKCARQYDIPGTGRTRVSRGTIELWITKYRSGGQQLTGLMPATRIDKGVYKCLDVNVRMALRDLRIEDPKATLPVLITRLRNKHLLGPEENLNSSNCYRFLNSVEVDCGGERNADRRRFEAEYPNAIWQCDILHGPQVRLPDGTTKKSYLCGIMDDHSRLLVHGQFYLNETAGSLKDCLRQAIQKRGVPQKFYVDNGACYRSESLENTCAWIGTALIHSRPYIPQGRGKIERFFRTVRESFLKIHEDRTLTLEKLNELFDSWLDEYHSREHSSLGTTPIEKFTADMSSVRPAPANLIEHFRESETRLVRRDRTVQLNGSVFEIPQGLIGKKVELRFHFHAPDAVEVFFQNYSHGFARRVDVHVNARVGRNITGASKNERETERVDLEVQPAFSGGQLFGLEEGEDDV